MNNFKYISMLIVILTLFVYQSLSWNIKINTIKKFQNIAIGIASLSLVIPNYNVYADDNTQTIVETSKLTAEELLQSNIQPRLSLLKDIETSFTQYDSYISSRDYLSIRSALRQEPTVELRKTCRSLKKYLTSEKQAVFDKAYNDMISSIDDLDSLALKRTRGDGIPSGDKIDDEMAKAVSVATNKLDGLIKIAE